MKKNNCIECKKETTNFVYILTGKGWIYEPYCLNCARAFLGKLSRRSFINLNLPSLNQASREYDILLQQNIHLIKEAGFLMEDVPIEFKRNIMERTS